MYLIFGEQLILALDGVSPTCRK